MTYNLKWLTNKFDAGERLKFLFFWGHSNKLGEVEKTCFSQWFDLSFTVDEITYKTAEHWMMANKALLFDDLKTFNKIINARSPAEAKKLGRDVLGFDEHVWIAKRVNIVVTGNIHKFNQHPEYAKYLIDTNERILVEASPVDIIWGVGLSKDDEHIDNPYCWNGENLLGFALMEVRDFLVKVGHFKDLDNVVERPWKKYPSVDPRDMFWRMGEGEDVLGNFFKYVNRLSERDRTILKLTNPVYFGWEYRNT